MVTIDFGPVQLPIDRERILEMITWKPRRMQLANEWPKTLNEPGSEGEDWNLVLPFCETFRNAFNCMCLVPCIGLREGKGSRCYTFLKEIEENPENLQEVQKWIRIIGRYVVMRDCLALSFALDYDRACGNPDSQQTNIGALRSRAKPYDASPTPDTYVAANELVKACLDFLGKVTCYDSTNVVVAMPPSMSNKPFDLPSHLAAGIAKGRGLNNLSDKVRTIRQRKPLKNCALAEKLAELEGTVSVENGIFLGKIILLVDDLYQSGISMNYVAMLLLEAGATKVFGLACEKTCRNDDNI